MLKRLEQGLKVQPQEWRLVLALMGLLALNTLVLELADVVAMAGFISSLGTEQLLWLWPVGMLLTIVAAGSYALIVDRTERVKLIQRLLAGFGACYLGLLALFWFKAPAWLLYPALSILNEQQYAIFPLAFWALANDIYATSEAKRLFPLLGAGATIGSLLGNGLAALIATWLVGNDQDNTSLVLGVCAGLCFLAISFVWLVFRRYELRARQSKSERESIRATFNTGLDVIRHVPLFRLLALVLFTTGLALTVIEFHFLRSIDQIVAADPLRFQQLYGFYKLGFVLVLLLFQWLLAGRLLSKTSPKQAFIALPIVLLLCILGALAQPLIGGLIGRFGARLAQTGWDEPLRKSVQSIVPDERRGRVSVFLDSYCYSFATIVGCGAISLILLPSWLGGLAASLSTLLYLGFAVLATAVGLWAAWRIRHVYDKSLLNWRLSRSRRRSVLDGIEF
ncbi:MFS transporter [Herpetosiphon giganteus]|uniref:MFS transporter n=1 Tax=Herpetosiphon giganteus TaxID=2029754 RepID=UPI0019584D22|nr:MFS transporter [Herpetosiphon giganteus]MBM7842569.1 ATP/ADP translocase [Herpetosiphon giganteus]